MPRLGFDGKGQCCPRAHDLRHSFAVGTLLRWYREGIEPANRLLYLSTFLGHTGIHSTAVYLTCAWIIAALMSLIERATRVPGLTQRQSQ